MTYITTAYATRSETEQEICAEPVEILSLDDCVVSVAEWCAFERRLDTRLTFSTLRQHVCLDYELGCVDAVTSMQRLKDENLLGNPDQFMAIFAAGVRSLAAISSAQLKSASSRDEVSAASQVVGLTHKIEGGR